MNESRYNLYKLSKKWVITAVTATSIGIGGHTLINSKVVYADTSQVVTAKGNYLEMASNASKDAKSYADIVSSISNKWQFCPGGDSLTVLRDQASNYAINASVSSSRVSQPNASEQEQSLATADALSYAADASSVAVIATSSENSISSVASSMASSAQYKLGIYKSFASSVTSNAQNYRNDLISWSSNEDIQNSPLLTEVNYLTSLSNEESSYISVTESIASVLNSMANSVSDVISKNEINNIDSGMKSLSNEAYFVDKYNNELSYSSGLEAASNATKIMKNNRDFHQLADSLNSRAKYDKDQKISDSAFAFSAALSSYETFKNIYVKMYKEVYTISNYATNTPYKRYVNLPTDSETNDFKLRLLSDIENIIESTDFYIKQSIDDRFYANLAFSIDDAKRAISKENSLASYFSSQVPIESVVSLENNNISMANSAYSMIDSLSSEVNIIEKRNMYYDDPTTSSSATSSSADSSSATSSSADSSSTASSSADSSLANSSVSFSSISSTNSILASKSITSFYYPVASKSSTVGDIYYSSSASNGSSNNLSSNNSNVISSADHNESNIGSMANSSMSSSVSNENTAKSYSNSNKTYKQLYSKIKNDLINKINTNKVNAAKYKHDYQKAKSKNKKANKLKQYRDAKSKLDVLQKQLKYFNKK